MKNELLKKVQNVTVADMQLLIYKDKGSDEEKIALFKGKSQLQTFIGNKTLKAGGIDIVKVQHIDFTKPIERKTEEPVINEEVDQEAAEA